MTPQLIVLAGPNGAGKSTEIDLWTLWPLYPEELAFKKDHGAHALADLIELAEVRDVVDPNRASLIRGFGSVDSTQPRGGAADTGAMKNKIVIPDIPGFETAIEPIPAGVDPRAFLQQQMDDCPLCREARARGEVPELHTGDELAAMVRPRRNKFAKRPRWRTMKRGR